MCKMLVSASIPVHGDDPKPWPFFLRKAAKGSAKALDVLGYAEMSYAIDVARDPRAIEWPRARVLALYADAIGRPPTVQRLLDVAAQRGWVAERTELGERPSRLELPVRWGGPPVEELRLVRVAAHRCVTRWSGEEIESAVQEDFAAYDAAHVVSAMLLMSYTWPEPLAVR